MGNDGGSIPDRRDLVKTKAKAEQADKANQTKARWFYCALSKKRLQEPVVSCPLGKLYNKDAIIEFLLDKSAYGDGDEICGHIRSLKDVTTLKLTPNSTSSSTSSDPETSTPFACPLTLKEMNGVQPFVYISTCGCVFSQAGLRTVSGSSKPSATSSSSSSSTPPQDAAGDGKPDSPKSTPEDTDLCPQCGASYNRTTDVILLNPSPDEEQTLRWAMEKRRFSEPSKASKTKSKSKKRKNHPTDAAPEDTTPDASAPPASASHPKKQKKQKQESSQQAQPSINSSIGTASRAVMQGLKEEEEKRKANMSEAVKSLYGDGKPARKETFMTMGTFTRYA